MAGGEDKSSGSPSTTAKSSGGPSGPAGVKKAAGKTPALDPLTVKRPSSARAAASLVKGATSKAAPDGSSPASRASTAAKDVAGDAVKTAAVKAAGKGAGLAATYLTGGNAAAGKAVDKATQYVTSRHGKKVIIVVALAVMAPTLAMIAMLTLAASGVSAILASQQGDSDVIVDTCTAATGLSFEISPEQTAVAQTIVDVGADHDVPPRGVQIALMTAIQESKLTNLKDATGGDFNGTSVGVFQQISQWGWGTYAEITDVTKATEAFYGVSTHTSNVGLLDVVGWEDMAATDAAQAVQRSDFGDEYAKWEDDAKVLYSQLAGVGAGTGCVQGSGTLVGDLAYPLPEGSWHKSSDFSLSRYQPVLHIWRAHEGVDLAAAEGTEVYAVADGSVTWAGSTGGGGGLMVWIDYGDGISTHYLHLSGAVVDVGQVVSAGELVGYVGHSGGVSTGSHLHFEYRVDGTAIDPVPVMAGLGIILDPGGN